MSKSILSSVLLSAGLMVSAMSSVYAQVNLNDDKLEPGEYLTSRLDLIQDGKAKQCLFSQSKRYKLCVQGDGNAVLTDTDNGKARWSTKTASTDGYKLVMQGDGNLLHVGYSKVWWKTGTSGLHNAYLILRNDGYLVLYHEPRDVAWSAATN